jgi:hypothetical protein
MKILIDKSLDEYISTGNAITAELQASGSPLMDALKEFFDFFRKDLWSDNAGMSVNQSLLSLHAFLIYTSAVRMTLTGHVAATFPLFRTALEAACYAFLMGQDRSLEDIWAKRHASEQSARLCRKKFTSAVRDAARIIEKAGGGQGHGAWIEDCYQSSIDFGAHPNPRSVYPHVRAPVDEGEFYATGLTGLHAADSFEVSRSLMACLDYGLVLGVVLAHGLSEPAQAISKRLFELNELKERLTVEHFVVANPSAPGAT